MKNRLETTKNSLKALAVKNTAKEFNRSSDWVYGVLRGDINNKNTDGVKEYYEKEYLAFESIIKK